MKMDFAAAMRAATDLARAQKPMEATRVIQIILLLGRAQAEPPHEHALKARAIEPPTIDLMPNTPTSETTQPVPGSWFQRDIAATIRQTGLPSIALDGLTRLKPRKPLDIPDRAQYLSQSYACAAGQRGYKLYVPARAHSGRRALIVMLHGGTQDADDFAAGTRMNALAEEHGFLVAYPNQCKSANPSLCWNWFKPEDQMRGAGEPSIIAGITGEILRDRDVDPRQVFVAGLSAGGAMAHVMGETYPEVYAAVGVHSGLAYRSATDVASAFAAMRGDAKRRRARQARPVPNPSLRPRTIVFHGDADRIVHPSNAAKIVELSSKRGDRVEGEKTGSTAGRTYTSAITRDKEDRVVLEYWLIHGAGHAWSGGSADGTYTDSCGPDASREMLRFFLDEKPASND
jgi:poly(hydroxyalkanoate) depolymerase family esterase